MKTSLFSLLAGTALVIGVAAAQADSSVALSNSQLDTVVAGAIVYSTAASTAASGGSFNPIGAVSAATSGIATAAAANNCCQTASTSTNGISYIQLP